MINDALESLVAAVETERADVIQQVVKTVQKCEENDEGIGLTLNNLFRSECSDAGTILHLAVERRSKDSVRQLLTLGAFPSCKNEGGFTALEIAEDLEIIGIFNEQLLHNIAQGNLQRVEEFLDAGCDVNCIDSERTRNTPLHWAASYSTPDILQMLIDDGGNVNGQNADGVTPLHDAVQRKQPDIIKLLLNNNADPTLAAHSGKLAGKSSLQIADQSTIALLTRDSPTDSVRPTFNDLKHNNLSATTSNGSTRHPLRTPHGTVPAGLQDMAPPPPQRNELSALELKQKLMEQAKPTVTSSDHIYSEIMAPAVNGVSDASEAHESSSGDPTDRSTDLEPIERQLKLLWPTPQKLTIHPDRGEFKPADKLVIAAVSGPEPGLVHEILNAWRAKRSSFLDLHIEFVMETIAYQTTPAVITFDLPSIVCQVDKNLFKQPSSYKLTVLHNQIRVVASDLAGLHYAVSTLIQLLEIFDAEESVPCVQIHDWPDLKCRGVMLDCSKGRIVHEANLWELVDRLSILKINEIHLYARIEAPKVTSSNPDIWQFAYTRSMLIEFDRFCQQRFVTLVPVLDVSHHVDYEKISSLFPLFLDYLSCFTYSSKINIGPRLSLMLLEVGDTGILNTKNFLPLSDSHQLLLCGEALKQSGNMQQSLMWLPSNMMLMSYGYTADHNFTPMIKQYADYGAAYYVCPGTSAWNSLAGCPDAALQNIRNAAEQGQEYEALGMLICDWSGKGHVTDPLFSLPSLVAMAGLSWNKKVDQSCLTERLPHLINVHMLCDQKRAVGQVLLELGRLESDLLKASKNQQGDMVATLDGDHGSLLFQLFVAADTVDLTHLTPTHFQKALRTIRHLHGQAQTMDLQCYQGQEQTAAIKLSLDLALTACRIGLALTSAGRNPGATGGAASINAGIANLPVTAKTDIANRILAIREVYKSCWFSRYLPNGFQDSQAILFKVINTLLPDSTHHHT